MRWSKIKFAFFVIIYTISITVICGYDMEWDRSERWKKKFNQVKEIQYWGIVNV